MSVWSRSTENAGRRLRRVAVVALLCALPAVLPGAISCTEDGDGLSTSSTTASGGSTGGGASNGGHSTQGGLGPGGSDAVDAVDWGPVLLTAGALEALTIKDGIGVGRVACDVGKATERTYVYALDVRDGALIGTAEIPGRCYAVDIGTRYAFVWAEEGISVHDLTQDFAHVQTWDDRFVSDIGSYLYVEDRTGPDYLIDQATLTSLPLADAVQSPGIADEAVYALLYPDCLIGDPQALEGGSGGRAAVYSLGENAVIGHMPIDLVEGVCAWDPDKWLLFGTSFQYDALFAYSLDKEAVVAESAVTESEGRALAESLMEGGSGAYLGHGDRLRVIPDIRPAAGGTYVINGREGWYALDSSGEVQHVKEGAEAVAYRDDRVLAKSGNAAALESSDPDGGGSWLHALPEFFGTHPEGPYPTPSSIAWVNSCSGRKGHGDVVTQWGYDGSDLNATEFTGFEVKIMSADPFILALREGLHGEDRQWMLVCVEPAELPMNLVPDIHISYQPRTIHARSTEVTFTCDVDGLPASFTGDLSYEWELDGTTASGREITHVFPAASTYTVIVRVRAGDSLSVATGSIEVTVRDPLLPTGFKPVVTPDRYTAGGLIFSFRCSRLSPGVARAEWDFGDGTTGTGFNCSHEYRLGEYEARCRIYGTDGTLLYDDTLDIYAGYPFFDIDVTPREGNAPLTVRGTCRMSEPGFTDDGLRYSWYLIQDGRRAMTLSQTPSFTQVFREAKTYTIGFEVTDPGDHVVTRCDYTVVVAPITLTVTDQGRTIHSTVSMFVAKDRRGSSDDPDQDGLYQPWEDMFMEKVNPSFELDEGEDWLIHQDTDKVANFVRVSTFPEAVDTNDVRYVVVYFAIAWTKDYGRYEDCRLTQAHNGDVEKVVLAFEVVDDRTLTLAWVFTSAHSTNRHDGVWAARGESENTALICNVLGEVWGSEPMVASLEFVDDTLKLYTSEDKHANYPSEEVGESVRLVWLGMGPLAILETWLLEATGLTEYGTSFVQEDVGGGPVKRWPCYNVGEPTKHLMDDIDFLFRNERVWSGNRSDPTSFAGGLTPQTSSTLKLGSPGPIGGRLEMPAALLARLAGD